MRVAFRPVPYTPIVLIGSRSGLRWTVELILPLGHHPPMREICRFEQGLVIVTMQAFTAAL